MMNDLISRQALCEYALNQKDKSVTPNDIMRFPSAQADSKETSSTHKALDTISRQAAIDAIEKVDWFHQNKNKDMVSGANSSEHQAWYKADDIYKTLEALPSAQPETDWNEMIVICDCCGHAIRVTKVVKNDE